MYDIFPKIHTVQSEIVFFVPYFVPNIFGCLVTVTFPFDYRFCDCRLCHAVLMKKHENDEFGKNRRSHYSPMRAAIITKLYHLVDLDEIYTMI